MANTISFIIPVKNDIERLDTLLPSLRQYYSNERVILFSNETTEENLNSLKTNYVNQYNLELYVTDSTYHTDTPAKVYREMFSQYVKFPTDYLIKIDTDGLIYNRLSALDDSDLNIYYSCVFGSLHKIDNFYTPVFDFPTEKVYKPILRTEFYNYKIAMPTFVGGIVGFSKSAILKLILNDSFSVEKDAYYQNLYSSTRPNVSAALLKTNKISIDFVLGVACSACDVPMVDCPEIYSVCYHPHTDSFVSNILLDQTATLNELSNSAKYCFVHPVNRVTYKSLQM